MVTFYRICVNGSSSLNWGPALHSADYFSATFGRSLSPTILASRTGLAARSCRSIIEDIFQSVHHQGAVYCFTTTMRSSFKRSLQQFTQPHACLVHLRLRISHRASE